jgi:hypothetical protein
MTTQNQNDDSVEGDDSAVALAASYAAERTEVQNILGHALSLLSVLLDVHRCCLGDEGRYNTALFDSGYSCTHIVSDSVALAAE